MDRLRDELLAHARLAPDDDRYVAVLQTLYVLEDLESHGIPRDDARELRRVAEFLSDLSVHGPLAPVAGPGAGQAQQTCGGADELDVASTERNELLRSGAVGVEHADVVAVQPDERRNHDERSDVAGNHRVGGSGVAHDQGRRVASRRSARPHESADVRDAPTRAVDRRGHYWAGLVGHGEEHQAIGHHGVGHTLGERVYAFGPDVLGLQQPVALGYHRVPALV